MKYQSKKHSLTLRSKRIGRKTTARKKNYFLNDWITDHVKNNNTIPHINTKDINDTNISDCYTRD